MSRNSAAQLGPLVCDVANQGALWNNPDAHNYVRLYFRPRNSFHLKTEGIKSSTDQYRVDPHMTIPVMLAFDFVDVMTDPASRFLPHNFAIAGSQPQTGDQAFNELDFDKIYHDSKPPEGRQDEYLNARMAEVIFCCPLSLNRCKALIFRNDFDSETFRSGLLPEDLQVPEQFIDTNSAIFFKRGMQIRELYAADNNIFLQFTAPHVASRNEYCVRVVCEGFDQTYQLAANKKWRIPVPFVIGCSLAIYLENCLAFEGRPSTGANQVV